MKNLRINEELKDLESLSITVSNFPIDGEFELRIEEWENGEGYDFFFPDGKIALSHYELMGVMELYFKKIRTDILK